MDGTDESPALGTTEKPWYASRTVWVAVTWLFVTVAAAAETYLDIWLPLSRGEAVDLTRAQQLTILFKSVGLWAPVVFGLLGAVGVIYFRWTARAVLK